MCFQVGLSNGGPPQQQQHLQHLQQHPLDLQMHQQQQQPFYWNQGQ